MRGEIRKLEDSETVTKDEINSLAENLGPAKIGEVDERAIVDLWERSEDGTRMVRKKKQ